MKYFAFLCMFFLPAFLYSQKIDRNLWITDGGIYATYYDTLNSRLYIGGDFSYVGPNTGPFAKLDTVLGNKPDLTLPKINGTVLCITPDGNGGWYIGGNFIKVGDSLRHNLAHVTYSGEVDAWNPNTDERVFSIVLSGNAVFVAGFFYSIGGESISFLAKVDAATGAVDTNWRPNPNSSVRSLLLHEGSLYVGGSFSSIGGNSISCLAKLDTATGQSDSSWNPAPDYLVKTIASDDKYLYVGGNFFNMGTLPVKHLAKIRISDGEVVYPWGAQPDDFVESIVRVDSSLYIGGAFMSVSTVHSPRLAKIRTSDGNVSCWSVSADNNVYALYADKENDFLYIGGMFRKINDIPAFSLVRVSLSDGILDVGWRPNVRNFTYTGRNEQGHVYAISAYEGNIYFGGDFISCAGYNRTRLARFVSDTLDPNWIPTANGRILDILVDGETVYVGGEFTTVSGHTHNHMAALSASDGTLKDWMPDIDYKINSIACDDKYVYAAGYFWTVNGTSVNNLVKLDKKDATFVNTWQPDPDNEVHDIKLDGGYLYVAGSFITIGGKSMSYLARIDTNDAAVDTSWNPHPDWDTYSLAVTDSNVYVGGIFSQVGGQNIYYLAKLGKANALADTNWNPDPDNLVTVIKPDGNDIWVGGHFTAIAGVHRGYMAKLDAFNGSAATDFAPEFDYYVEDIEKASANKIYVAGTFSNLNSLPQPSLVSLEINLTAAEQEKSFAPLRYELSQNYPNPFNPTTTIQYTLEKSGFVTLEIYDALGRKVKTLVNGWKKKGVYREDFNAVNLASGIYFYTLRAGDFVITKKMILLK